MTPNWDLIKHLVLISHVALKSHLTPLRFGFLICTVIPWPCLYTIMGYMKLEKYVLYLTQC